MSRILIVDDDLELADVLAFAVRRAGFEVLLAHDGLTALSLCERDMPDLVVLDWGLPGCDGLEVCKSLRAWSKVPVLMLTVRSSDDDVVAALDAGADDYVPKPFSPRQLVARIRALIRRSSGIPEESLRAGSLSLDLDRCEACWEGQPPIRLTRLEARLLEALIQHADQVLSTDSLIVRVWGQGGATREMLKQLLHRLRSKIEPNPSHPTLIETIPHIGCVLNTPSISPPPI
jgi:DNA-binding response OmpR family regulator